MSVVTYHHRSNSRAIATAKRIHPISSDIVLGLCRARLSLPHGCRRNFSSDCRPWLGKVRLTIFAFRCPSAQLPRDQCATKAKRDDFSPAYPSPGCRTRRRPGRPGTRDRGNGWRVASPQTPTCRSWYYAGFVFNTNQTLRQHKSSLWANYCRPQRSDAGTTVGLLIPAPLYLDDGEPRTRRE